MHLDDDEPPPADWAALRRKVHYFHYWRRHDGAWLRNRLEVAGSRPQLRFDSHDNAYLVLTGDRYNPSNDLAIAAASARKHWTDWRILHREPGPFMGQPRLDGGQTERGVMAVYVQEQPKDLKSGESPLRVIEYSFGSRSAEAGK
jgi:hypothetical protein